MCVLDDGTCTCWYVSTCVFQPQLHLHLYSCHQLRGNTPSLPTIWTVSWYIDTRQGSCYLPVWIHHSGKQESSAQQRGFGVCERSSIGTPGAPFVRACTLSDHTPAPCPPVGHTAGHSWPRLNTGRRNGALRILLDTT